MSIEQVLHFVVVVGIAVLCIGAAAGFIILLTDGWEREPKARDFEVEEFVAYMDSERRLDEVIDNGRRLIIERAEAEQ